MFQECVNPGLIPILDQLVDSDILNNHNFYLAGGTALAMQLGHRLSVDLDFFTEEDFALQSLIISLNECMGEITIRNMSKGTINAIINGEKVSFLTYPYKNLFPLLSFRECPIADYRDIAASKLVTISQRGLMRDFYDLDTIIQKGLPFAEIIALMQKKYPTINTIIPHIIRSIGYFEDANNEPPPLISRDEDFSLLTELEWSKIKARFLVIQKNYLSQELDL